MTLLATVTQPAEVCAQTFHKSRFTVIESIIRVRGTRDKLCQVLPGLYASSAECERELALLTRHGITHILQVGRELEPTHSVTRYAYMHIDLRDRETDDLVTHLPMCIRFIDEGRREGAVLVHCAAGVSRSPAVLMAYLMASEGLTLAAARVAVRAVRPASSPNLGFLLQLLLWGEAGCSAEGWQPWSQERFLAVRRERMCGGTPRTSMEGSGRPE